MRASLEKNILQCFFGAVLDQHQQLLVLVSDQLVLRLLGPQRSLEVSNSYLNAVSAHVVSLFRFHALHVLDFYADVVLLLHELHVMPQYVNAGLAVQLFRLLPFQARNVDLILQILQSHFVVDLLDLILTLKYLSF